MVSDFIRHFSPKSDEYKEDAPKEMEVHRTDDGTSSDTEEIPQPPCRAAESYLISCPAVVAL